jgi:UDP-2,3-diacylglucosamine pyrophosphatase LpxH
LEASKHGVDGIICGHIHHAAMHDRLGIRYMNCGDWVESCTALVERHDGVFELIHWPTERGRFTSPHLSAREPEAAAA